MAIHDDVIQSIERGPGGPEIGAFFDFDGTLIAGYSAAAFIKEQLLQGHVTAREFLELIAVMTNFGLGKLGFSGLMVANAQTLRGVTEESYIEFGEEIYAKHIARLVYPESRALVDAHLRKGHTVAIISSATPYQVEPAARDLAIDKVLCTRLEVEDGVFTGGVVRPTCWGQGKVTAAERLADEYGLDLESSYFYSDSHEDLALLERVGHPQPLNPNDKLQEIATRRGWPVRRFGSRGRPSAGEILRSILASVSLLPAFLAGLPVWALTGSKREAQNFSVSLFADTAAALIGMDLNVKGERHLWSHRPAVFVFNHQSKADVIILAKLLRRDMAGVGKKEIGEIPVIGKIMEFGGTVLIDRKNAASAIAAMAPLVDVMREGGKSVVLAPEGTRTLSPKLAPFKKGAFHLAIQAGVPMVPIVIRNAIDVSPKGDFVFRPATVEVEVLPPVDTSGWKSRTIAEHVKEVRGMFLRALDQAPEAVPQLPSVEIPAVTPSMAKTRSKSQRIKGKTKKAKKQSDSIDAGSGGRSTEPKSRKKKSSRKKAAARAAKSPVVQSASKRTRAGAGAGAVAGATNGANNAHPSVPAGKKKAAGKVAKSKRSRRRTGTIARLAGTAKPAKKQASEKTKSRTVRS